MPNTPSDQQWNWRPDDPVALSPLFEWPWRPFRVVRWVVASWHVITVRVPFLLLAFATWAWLSPELARCREFAVDWILEIHLRNLGFMLLVAGGLQLYLHRYRMQGLDRRYELRELVAKAKTFLGNNQVLDNMAWTLLSGVTVWTGFEALLMWGYANGYVPMITWQENPVWFVAIFLLIPIWGSFHFYMIHRALHWPWLYRLAHSVHHRNIVIGPWSGMSMHPVEHLMYLSTVLIHWVVTSHPVHVLYHLQLKALEAATSHCGYESLLVGERRAMLLGDFFHQMHHRYFDCNYGTLEMPWDRWFGSFHDGSPEGHAKIRERRRRLSRAR